MEILLWLIEANCNIITYPMQGRESDVRATSVSLEQAELTSLWSVEFIAVLNSPQWISHLITRQPWDKDYILHHFNAAI